MQPDVAVVVLTHDRPQELRRCLQHVEALAERPEIVVVDNASRVPAQVALGHEFPGVRFVRNELNLGAAGRNLGVAATHAALVAFCDDDCWWEPGALAHAAGLFERQPRLGVVSGQIRVGAARCVDATCARMARNVLGDSRDGAVRILGFMAGACMIRVKAFRQAGGYEPRFFLGGEEELLALDLAAAGWEMRYSPFVRVCHWPSEKRDAPSRVQLLMRNAVWVAWLRLPWWTAVRMSLSFALACVRAGHWPLLADTIRHGRWTWRERAVVPVDVRRLRQRARTDGRAPARARPPGVQA